MDRKKISLFFVSFIFHISYFQALNPSKNYTAVSLALPEKKSVTLLTLNTALLNVFFGTIDIGLKNNKKRATMIGKAIRTMLPQPGIIVLQEAFDRKALEKKLYPEIKDLYPYTFFDKRWRAYLGGVGSGLAIISKYPITRAMQKDFTCWAGVEALARKGIMGVELSIDGCPLYVINAHFQAGVDKEWYLKFAAGLRSRSCEGKNPNSLTSSQIVQMELRQAKKEIYSFVTHKKAPILFTGDFNISRLRDLDDYFALLTTFPHAFDSYYNGSKKIKSSSWENGSYAKTETDRVDYVWLLNPSTKIWIESDIIENFNHKMTDHLGILAKITFPCAR
jgi:endonuclease/exonuclease/phosphatase family metal-dependent hydrolase